MKKQAITKQDIQKELIAKLNKRKGIAIFLTAIVIIGIILYPIHLINYLNDAPFDYAGIGIFPDLTPEIAMVVMPLLIIFFAVKKDVDDIKSSGYVVASLEAALWCLVNTDNYKDCMLKAVNLGSDTDTVAAIAGGLAGLFYGYDGIPQDWLDVIQKRDWIENMLMQMPEVTLG